MKDKHKNSVRHSPDEIDPVRYIQNDRQNKRKQESSPCIELTTHITFSKKLTSTLVLKDFPRESELNLANIFLPGMGDTTGDFLLVSVAGSPNLQ